MAFLDILGFRGIWEAEDPKVVLEKLKAVEKISEVGTSQGTKFLKQAKDRLKQIDESPSNIKVRVFALSNSVVIAAWHQLNPKTDNPELLGDARIECVTHAALGASLVMRLLNSRTGVTGVQSKQESSWSMKRALS